MRCVAVSGPSSTQARSIEDASFSGGIQVSIEVGEGYITDLISLAPDVESMPMPVTAGQWLGTIVLGSRSEIVIPHSRIPSLGFDAVRGTRVYPK